MARRMGLVGEIGVDVVRLALTSLDNDDSGTLHHVQDLFPYDYTSALDAINSYLAGIGFDVAIGAASLAVAARVEGERAHLTNSDWTISGGEIARALKLDSVPLLNDFAAIALSLPHLKQSDIEIIAGPTLERGVRERSQFYGVIGVAAGLGVAGLFVEGARSTPVPSEGGHTAFAPAGELQTSVWKAIQRGHGRVSYEKVLSARGLQLLHGALETVSGLPANQLSASEIIKSAEAGDDWTCVETFNLFCQVLGAFAGDVALMLGASDGLYVTGDLLRPLGRLIRKGGFRECFEAKGPLRRHLELVPTPLITHASPSLVGLAASMRAEHAAGSYRG